MLCICAVVCFSCLGDEFQKLPRLLMIFQPYISIYGFEVCFLPSELCARVGNYQEILDHDMPHLINIAGARSVVLSPMGHGKARILRVSTQFSAEKAWADPPRLAGWADFTSTPPPPCARVDGVLMRSSSPRYSREMLYC
jgi:hypothetical protein